MSNVAKISLAALAATAVILGTIHKSTFTEIVNDPTGAFGAFFESNAHAVIASQVAADEGEGFAIGDDQPEPPRDTQPSFLPPGDRGPMPGGTHPDTPLGAFAFNFDEPLLRVNPTNPLNVVITSHSGMRISTDGGQNWAGVVGYPNLPGSVGNSGDTGMTFDSQGNLFWTTLVRVPDGMGGNWRNFQWAQINPASGALMGSVVDVVTAVGDGGVGGMDKEFIVADEYGATSPCVDNQYAVWGKLFTPWEVWVARTTNGGTTWTSTPESTDPLYVNGGDPNPWPFDIAVRPDGNVMVATHSNGRAGATGQTLAWLSTDCGASYAAITSPFTAGQSDVSTNVQDNGDGNFDTYNTGGTNGAAIPGLGFWMQGASQPWILGDPTRVDTWYVVSNDDPDNVHGNATDDADVVLATSTDDGTSWNVQTLPEPANSHQVFPFAAIDQFGNIAVAWFDTSRGLTNSFFTGDGSNGGQMQGTQKRMLDVFATYSTDGGATWATPFMVNDANNPLDPDFPGNQARFSINSVMGSQPTPCAKTLNTILDTCRIGEYFGIDIDRGMVHLTWIGNTFDGGGNVTGDQLWYDWFRLPTDIEISKSDSSDPVAAGTQFSYTLTVTNDGDVDAGNVVVVDTLPAQVNYVSASIPCTNAPANTVTCDLGVLTPGEVVNFSITVAVPPSVASGVVLTNNATVTSDNPETDNGDNSTSENTSVIRQIDIEVTKSDSPDPVVAGLELNGLTYIVTAENLGPSDASGVVINDPEAQFPADVVVESATPSDGIYDGTNWTVDLPFGSGAETLTLVLTVGPDAPLGNPGFSNTATFTGSGGGETDTNASNDSATEPTEVIPTTASWFVSKDFLDDNGSAVTASLVCEETPTMGHNTDAMSTPVDVSEGNSPQELIVTGFLQGPFGSTNCEAVESNLPPEYFQVGTEGDCYVEDFVHEDEFECLFINAPIRATFTVTKDFNDGNDAGVEIFIECTTGLPMASDATVYETHPIFDEIEFIVTSYDPYELDCSIHEDVPLGYSESYEVDWDEVTAVFNVEPYSSAAGCHFEEVGSGAYYCDITNELDQVPVTVDKVWIDELAAENGAFLFAGAKWRCDPVATLDDVGYTNDKGFLTFHGTPANPRDYDTFWIYPHYEGSFCDLTEFELDSDIFTDDSDCQGIEVLPGYDLGLEDDDSTPAESCTIINTRIYAGIPTVNEYGLVLLALLMLGIGFVGFRRFV